MVVKTEVQIRFSDIDSLGHVYNSIYNTYFDLGKGDFFQAILGMPPVFKGKGVVQASLTTNFYKPIFIDDKIVVESSLERVGNRSFVLFQTIRSLEDGAVRSDCRSTLVCFDVATQSSMDMPDEWRNSLMASVK